MIVCTNCHRPLPDEGHPFRCPTCGGLLDFAAPFHFDPSQVDAGQPGIWRYRHTFELPEAAPVITLGEGQTPLVWAEAFERQVAFKLEFLNPSASFKDRGSAVLLSSLCSQGVDAAVEDSSGNAGASFAAYAGRAGVEATVYVPESASGPKRDQIAAYGARVIAVPGPRSRAAEAVLQAVEQGAVYASHAYLPWHLAGYATCAYELVDQLGEGPGSVLVPAGQGGFLLGLSRGFKALKNAGVIEHLPVLVGVQARACAPLWAVSRYGHEGLSWVAEGPTVAEGIRILRPLRGDAVLREVEAGGGLFVSVEEDEILSGRDQLARKGFYVEATSAVVWDALAQTAGQIRDPVVAILTGSGLKST